MSANIEALVKKHSRAFSGDIRGLRNALTEQAEAFKGELQAYDGTVRELTKTVEDMRAAQSVPVVEADQVVPEEIPQNWTGVDGAVAWHLIDRHGEGWAQIGQMMDAWLKANSITAAELATLREKAAMVDELRKDAERYRWLRDPSVYVGKVIDKVAGYEPMTELGTGGYPIYEYRAGPELDEAIDAAIAQGKGE